MSQDKLMKKTQYIHVRNVVNGVIQPKGGATLCYLPSISGDAHALGFAFCSHNDCFDKKMGRQKSRGRCAIAWKKAHYCRNLLTMEQAVAQAKALAISKDIMLANRQNRERMQLQVISKFKGD